MQTTFLMFFRLILAPFNIFHLFLSFLVFWLQEPQWLQQQSSWRRILDKHDFPTQTLHYHIENIDHDTKSRH